MSNARHPAKIFGIGLNKTGTSTLGACFDQLGYRQMSSRSDVMEQYLSGDKQKLFDLCDAYEAFQDWPYPLAYRDLFERYGNNARFVLTLRKSPEIWLKSLKKHTLRAHPDTKSQKLAYGHTYPHGYEQQFVDLYVRHNREVVEFFTQVDARDQLLEICWEEGDGWEKLCKFLGHEVPPSPFPHITRTRSQDVVGKRNYAKNMRCVKRQLDDLNKPYEDHIDTPYSEFSLGLPRKLRLLAWRSGLIS